LLDVQKQSSDRISFDAVVVGLAPSLFTYEYLNTAFRILKRETNQPHSTQLDHSLAIPLIATHKGRYIQSPDGALSLGPGPFVTALEEASGVQAEVVGKPSSKFFQTVIDGLALGDDSSSGGRIAIIGDDIEADLGGGAVDLGLWRVLGGHIRNL
jgi:ribonucleotide monophosphatase NagD (HAD superfamily)